MHREQEEILNDLEMGVMELKKCCKYSCHEIFFFARIGGGRKANTYQSQPQSGEPLVGARREKGEHRGDAGCKVVHLMKISAVFFDPFVALSSNKKRLI